MIRVLIADDHTIVREGLKQIFKETSDIIVTGEAANGSEVIEKIKYEKYDLVVLDISMPGRGGLDVLKYIKLHNPTLPVLVLSMYSEDQYAIRVLKAGASGYLTKESAAEKLISAVRRIYNGHKYVSLELAEKLADCLNSNYHKLSHEALSDREFQVLRLIGSGMTVGEIAEELSLSVKTISTNRARILEKMGMKNNAELICYAIRHNLVK
ncbi:MAG: response regulator transcription factor [Candidatus Marinimicrobia bacterium]|nr:response regulator transcription factor [Candidatus Neomarinimicrobiota bacterium]RKY57173.1 MAG: DNA-binding response regulator [Candidatus Neomarinimicrobiota bacterium]